MSEHDLSTEQGVVAALHDSQYSDSEASPESARAREVINANVEQAAATAPESDEVSQEQPEEDSFTGLNPAELPAELVPFYKSMQADYTRTKQGLAEQAKQFETLEEFGGPEVASQALEWIASLQNPENALALQRELTAALQQQGYSLEEASQEAGRQVAEAQAEEQDDIFESRDPRVDELQKKLEDLERFREEEQQRQVELMMAAEYDRAEAEILRNNPDYKDEDMEALYALSYSTGGNLHKANELYLELQSRILGQYVTNKQNQPGSTAVRSGGPAEVPTSFKRLDDPNLQKAVDEFVQQELSAGG